MLPLGPPLRYSWHSSCWTASEGSTAPAPPPPLALHLLLLLLAAAARAAPPMGPLARVPVALLAATTGLAAACWRSCGEAWRVPAWLAGMTPGARRCCPCWRVPAPRASRERGGRWRRCWRRWPQRWPDSELRQRLQLCGCSGTRHFLFSWQHLYPCFPSSVPACSSPVCPACKLHAHARRSDRQAMN